MPQVAGAVFSRAGNRYSRDLKPRSLRRGGVAGRGSASIVLHWLRNLRFIDAADARS